MSTKDPELESMERKLRRRQSLGSAGLGALAVGGACTVTALDWATFIGVIVGAAVGNCKAGVKVAVAVSVGTGVAVSVGSTAGPGASPGVSWPDGVSTGVESPSPASKKK